MTRCPYPASSIHDRQQLFVQKKSYKSTEMRLQTKAVQSSKWPAAILKAVTRSTAKLEFSHPASIRQVQLSRKLGASPVTATGVRRETITAKHRGIERNEDRSSTEFPLQSNFLSCLSSLLHGLSTRLTRWPQAHFTEALLLNRQQATKTYSGHRFLQALAHSGGV